MAMKSCLFLQQNLKKIHFIEIFTKFQEEIQNIFYLLGSARMSAMFLTWMLKHEWSFFHNCIIVLLYFLASSALDVFLCTIWEFIKGFYYVFVFFFLVGSYKTFPSNYWHLLQLFLSNLWLQKSPSLNTTILEAELSRLIDLTLNFPMVNFYHEQF